MSALTVTLGADISSMRRSLGGAMGVISGFAKRISGVFSLKGGIVGALAGGSTAALATKLNAAGEAGNTANARIQSVARSMGLFAIFKSGYATRLVLSCMNLAFATRVRSQSSHQRPAPAPTRKHPSTPGTAELPLGTNHPSDHPKSTALPTNRRKPHLKTPAPAFLPARPTKTSKTTPFRQSPYANQAATLGSKFFLGSSSVAAYFSSCEGNFQN
jgi:hypothetical protein